MEWVFCLNQHAAGWFSDMIRVAVVSAREHTRLEPLCLFDGKGSPAILRWLKRRGVRIIRTQVPFRDELHAPSVRAANAGTPYTPEQASGAYLRLMAASFVRGDRFLYTDCDVMFLGDPEPLLPAAPLVAACPEVHVVDGSRLIEAKAFNSGVLHIHRAAFEAERPAIIAHARSQDFYSRATFSFDQTILNQALERRWEALDARLNWRPFQGINPDARIVHFHGPKPAQIRALLAGEPEADAMIHLRCLFEQQPEAFRHYIALFEAFLARSA